MKNKRFSYIALCLLLSALLLTGCTGENNKDTAEKETNTEEKKPEENKPEENKPEENKP